MAILRTTSRYAPDGFAAALAKFRNAELVTGDREFRQLENEVQIHWV